MKKSIFMSINPKAINNIITKEKNFEFRNYVPKKDFDYIFVYTISPKSEIKYILKINNIVSYPNKINDQGIGNIEFNSGKKTKYAYEIDSVYEIIKPLRLDYLIKTYDFHPPQSFVYSSAYPKLNEQIIKSSKTKII